MQKFSKYMLGLLLIVLAVALAACDSGDKQEATKKEKPADAPDTWIADRTIKGLVFESANDASVEMNPEIQAYIKKRTGITLELQGITTEDSTSALAAGLAAGDLPDFVAFYLNNSGRPEMSLLLKAANEGMFTNLTPLIKDTKVYSKYLQPDYLPEDTRNNIMFRKEWKGNSYLMHMSINRKPGDAGKATVGGPYIRKDIVDKLGINPLEIDSTQKLYDLAVKIKNGHFKDHNGKDISVMGPTIWGGSDSDFLFNDLVWTGTTGEKFMKNADGKIVHESQTDYGMKRVEFVQKLLKEGLMNPEYYTMEETRAREGIVNESFAIVADMHNYVTENNNMTYVPLGPIKRADGTNDMVINYKSGYAGWAIPSTTANPEEVVKFADWLASDEGKRLYFYGLEGRDYTLDKNGKPVVKKEVLDLLEKDPEKAKKLGFRGVKSYWGEHLAYTDMDNQADFGEQEYGEKVQNNSSKAPQKILDFYHYNDRLKKARVIDGLSTQSFLYEFEGESGSLTKALERYNEDLKRAYYVKSPEQAKQILDQSRQNLEANGLNKFLDFVQKKVDSGVKVKF